MNLLPLVPVECNDIIKRVTFMTTKYAYSPESISQAWKEYTLDLTNTVRALSQAFLCDMTSCCNLIGSPYTAWDWEQAEVGSFTRSSFF